MAFLFLAVACQPIAPTATVVDTATVAATKTLAASLTSFPSPSATPLQPQMRLVGTFGAGDFPFIARSPDGKRIFTVINNKELRWYDANTFAQEGSFVLGNNLGVYQIVFGSNPDLVVVVGDSGASVVDIQSQKLLVLIHQDSKLLSGVQFSHDANVLFYRFVDLSVYTQIGPDHSILAATNIQQGTPLNEFVASGDCEMLSDPVISLDDRWIAAGCDNLIKIWDVQTGAVLRTLKGHSNSVTDVLLSKDGTILISADKDGGLGFWDSQTGKSLRSFSLGKGMFSLSFPDDDGQQVLMKFYDGSAQLIDLKTYQIKVAPDLMPTIDPFFIELNRQGYSQSASNADLVSISPDGKTLAKNSGQSILLWDVETQKVSGILENPMGYPFDEIHFDPTGNKVVGMNSRHFLFWDAKASAQPRLPKVLELVGNGYWPGSSFSPDGKRMTVVHNTNVEIWDVEAGKRLKTWHVTDETRVTFGTQFSPDGQFVYVIIDPGLRGGIGLSQKTLQVWDLEKGRKTQQIDFHEGEDSLSDFALRWPWFAFQNGDAGSDWIELWNAETKEFQKIETANNHVVVPLVFSRNGNLLFGSNFDDLVYIWQVKTGKLLYTIKLPNLYFDFSLSQTSNDAVNAISVENGVVQVWDLGEIARYADQMDTTPTPAPTP